MGGGGGGETEKETDTRDRHLEFLFCQIVDLLKLLVQLKPLLILHESTVGRNDNGPILLHFDGVLWFGKACHLSDEEVQTCSNTSIYFISFVQF